jgi:hypothetical protein
MVSLKTDEFDKDLHTAGFTLCIHIFIRNMYLKCLADKRKTVRIGQTIIIISCTGISGISRFLIFLARVAASLSHFGSNLAIPHEFLLLLTFAAIFLTSLHFNLSGTDSYSRIFFFCRADHAAEKDS